MGTYDSILDRSDASALIPEDAATEIVGHVPEQSTVLRFMRKLPNMTRKQRRLPVVSALPTAYFVDGEPEDGATSDGLKETTKMKWEDKYINAEELACIAPVPEAVLADADYDIWAQMRPYIVEAIGVAIDAAVIHGTNAPTAWPTDIVSAANSAGNSVALGTGVDLYDDLLNEDGVFSAIESDGYMADGCIAATTLRGKLRGLRDADGNPIFKSDMQGQGTYTLDGAPIYFPKNGALDATAALLIAGQWSEVVYSIREDITFKVLTEATLQDAAGDIVFNLAQQDMIALRVTFRLGWQVPNPINRMQSTAGSRYPLGVLTPSA